MAFSRALAFLSLLLALALALPAAALAAHLGAVGRTYAIGEESALGMIMNKLRAMERSGELKRYQDEAVRRSLGSIRNPPPVPGIVSSMTRSERWLDPTVMYRTAVTGEDGRVVIPAGTRINPLEIMALSKRLVFFDGRDAEQSEAVRRLLQKYPGKITPILVAGRWRDLTRAWHTQLYYDQQGRLSQRFGIRAVPTLISQQGRVLLLQEIPAKELQ